MGNIELLWLFEIEVQMSELIFNDFFEWEIPPDKHPQYFTHRKEQKKTLAYRRHRYFWEEKNPLDAIEKEKESCEYVTEMIYLFIRKNVNTIYMFLQY